MTLAEKITLCLALVAVGTSIATFLFVGRRWSRALAHANLQTGRRWSRALAHANLQTETAVLTECLRCAKIARELGASDEVFRAILRGCPVAWTFEPALAPAEPAP